jgi:hypothetical protein
MKIFNSFELFWNEFIAQKPNKHGFHDWQVVSFLHVNDEEYNWQRLNGKDELGFQPFTITLANPLKQEIKEYIIKNVTDKLAEQFLAFNRDRYIKELDKRFGNFTPNETHAFAEYENWEDFYSHWLERNGKQVFAHNVPLLFDHTPRTEYLTLKQSGATVLHYQRLLITTYFVSKKQFFTFFIKNVDDEQNSKIKMLVKSRISLNIEEFLSTKLKVNA